MRRAKTKGKARKNYRRLHDEAAWKMTVLEREIEVLRERIDMMKEDSACAAQYRFGFEDIRARLEATLDADQREAAKICGVTTHDYAINLIRLCKQKIDELKAWR